MPPHVLLCRSATIFGAGGVGLDEEAYRAFLQRFKDASIGIYVGSTGSGEGHAMTRDELSRIYRISVEECKGRIPVNANPPEHHTAAKALEQALLAAEAGVEVVNIYGPAGWHSFKPTEEEYAAFFDRVFHGFSYPAALTPNPAMGYTPSPRLIASLCAKHRQVVAVNCSGLDNAYFIALKNELKRDVDVFVPYETPAESLALGVAGLLAAEANIIPKTFRRYLDLLEQRDLVGASEVFAQLRRVSEYLRSPRWASSPKWIKMFLKIFKLPGGNGGLREPYLMPSEKDQQSFLSGLLTLGVPEITELAIAAGLTRRQ